MYNEKFNSPININGGNFIMSHPRSKATVYWEEEFGLSRDKFPERLDNPKQLVLSTCTQNQH